MSVKVGDLELFKSKNNAYLDFIRDIKSLLTEANEQYEGINVSLRTAGYTKVKIKHENHEVTFVYRNRDLYIIGVIVGNKCYMDVKANSEIADRKLFNKVIAPATTEALSTDFSYDKIMPKKEKTQIRISDLEFNLQKLTKIGDKNHRMTVLKNDLSPFVILFAEAIRFPVIAKAAQQAFRTTDGTLKLSLNIAPPSLKQQAESIQMFTLLLIWGKLSTCVGSLFGNGECVVTIEVMEHETDSSMTIKDINVDKKTLKLLLGVANSYNVPSARGKRETPLNLLELLPQRLPLPPVQEKLLDHDGNPQQPKASTLNGVMQSADVTGALHLLALAMLHLTKRKLHQTESDRTNNNQKESEAIATDLADRVICFIKASRGSELEDEYEAQMGLQRQLAVALFRGEKIDGILSNFITEHGLKAIEAKTIGEMLSRTVDAGKCFQ